jgi:hypothetical protein
MTPPFWKEEMMCKAKEQRRDRQTNKNMEYKGRRETALLYQIEPKMLSFSTLRNDAKIRVGRKYTLLSSEGKET